MVAQLMNPGATLLVETWHRAADRDVCSGGFDPRKNFERLIEAYESLPTSVRRHQLE